MGKPLKQVSHVVLKNFRSRGDYRILQTSAFHAVRVAMKQMVQHALMAVANVRSRRGVEMAKPVKTSAYVVSRVTLL